MKGQALFASKTIVITGASSGVGRAIAVELSKYGANLVLAARRADALEEVAAECAERGAHTITVITDTRSAEDIHELAARAVEWKGSIDVWINNAGVLAVGSLEDMPSQVTEDVIRVNLLGYIHGAHAVVPYFKKQGHGTLINNISVGGWFPVPYGAAYTASKFGLRGFSEALKGELRSYPNIHVCELYPAFLDTPGIQHAANYTGKVIKPAPPVYDPVAVARAVVSIIQAPRPQVTIGTAAGLLRIAHFFLPVLTRTITAGVIKAYLKQANDIEHTSGNVLKPVGYGTSIHGGWSKPGKRSAAMKAGIIAGSIGGLALGYLLTKKKAAID